MPDPCLQQIAEAVCAEMGGRPSDLLGSTRGSPADALRRWVAIHFYSRARPLANYTRLGEVFGRDRTSARYALEQVKSRAARSSHLRGQMQRIDRALRRR